MLKTGLLLAAITALFLAVGYAVGGEGGMVVAFLIALAMNFFAYWNSDKIVLAMHHARPLDSDQHPELAELIQRLAIRAGIPVPKAYIIDVQQPNAFATGRNPAHGAVAVTTGLLNILNQRELAAVLAHEMGHIRNYDTLTMTVTATIAGAIGMLANFLLFFGGRQNGRNNPLLALVLVILAPIAASLVQLAISRTREYGADEAGAEISDDPLALASALRKISQSASRIVNVAAENNPATAHLFIVNPLKRGGMDNLFATHPNTENRISALERIAIVKGSHSSMIEVEAEKPTPHRSFEFSRKRSPWG